MSQIPIVTSECCFPYLQWPLTISSPAVHNSVLYLITISRQIQFTFPGH